MSDDGTVTRKFLAHALSVSEPTISKWVDQGAPCIDRGRKGVPAKFDPRAFIAWWKDTIVMAGAKKPEKLYEREQIVDIETKELKLRQMKAELIDRAAAVHVVRGMHTQTAAVFRQGPRRYGAQLVNLPDVAAAVEVFARIAEDQIRDLRLPDAWKAISDGVDATPAEGSPAEAIA